MKIAIQTKFYFSFKYRNFDCNSSIIKQFNLQYTVKILFMTNMIRMKGHQFHGYFIPVKWKNLPLLCNLSAIFPQLIFHSTCHIRLQLTVHMAMHPFSWVAQLAKASHTYRGRVDSTLWPFIFLTFPLSLPHFLYNPLALLASLSRCQTDKSY